MNYSALNKSSCEETRAALDSYMSGELPATERRGVSEHLQSCAPCAETLEGRERVRSLLRRAVRAECPPCGLAERIGVMLRSG